MSLYNTFLEIDPKKSKQVINFLVDNCESCRDLMLLLVAMNAPGQEKINHEIFLNIKNKMSLERLSQTLKDFNLDKNCEGCGLCSIKNFREKRQTVKKLICELNDINGDSLLINLNKMLSENLEVTLSLKKINRGKYSYNCKFRNLYQNIFFDLIENYKDRLDALVDLQDYFSQIAQILISTKKFIKDIKIIRDSYMHPKGNFYYRKDNILPKIIFDEIQNLRVKYKLYRRWEVWIYNILSHDISKYPSEIYNSIPDGSVYGGFLLPSNYVKKEITKEPFIVGDEAERNISDFKAETGQAMDIEIRNNRRKPITEFKKQLRWYKLMEERKSYIDIIDSELDSHIEDWEEFRDYKDAQSRGIRVLVDGKKEEYYERMAINRIKVGIKIIKDRIYKEYK